MDYLESQANVNQILLDRFKNEMTNSSVPRINALVRDVNKLLVEYDFQNLSKTELDKLRSEIVKIENERFEIYINDSISQLEELAEIQAVFEVDILEDVTKVAITAPAAAKMIRAVKASQVGTTGRFVQDIFKDLKATEIKSLDTAIINGYASGKTTDAMTRELRSSNGAFKQKAYKDTREAVHTTVQHVANSAREQVYANNSDIVAGVQIVATLDSRTSTICRALDGEVYPIGQGDRPPFHRGGCRTTVIAKLSEQFDKLSRQGERVSEFGKVSQKEDYYDWLGNRPRAFQESVLGKNRAKLFRDGGLSKEEFKKLQLDKNLKPLTLAEMRKLNPVAFEKAGL